MIFITRRCLWFLFFFFFLANVTKLNQSCKHSVFLNQGNTTIQILKKKILRWSFWDVLLERRDWHFWATFPQTFEESPPTPPDLREFTDTVGKIGWILPLFWKSLNGSFWTCLRPRPAYQATSKTLQTAHYIRAVVAIDAFVHASGNREECPLISVLQRGAFKLGLEFSSSG